MQKVVAKLSSGEVISFLSEHFKNVNLRNTPFYQENGTDLYFKSNEQFWNLLLRENSTAFKSLTLEGFRIVDWFPRTPGLYHKENTFLFRRKASFYLREEKGIKFYEPDGKSFMIQGGIGSVRFKPVKVENQDCLLCTATSDDYCHSGIPLAIPDRLVSKIDFDDYKLYFQITGKVKFLPKFLENNFRHMSRIPQIYVLVDNFKVVSTNKLAEPIKITPMVFFTTEDFTIKTKKENKLNLNEKVTYVTCNAHSNEEIDIACDWMKSYVSKYDGTIITNFDEQRPAFESVPFSLQNIMNDQIFNNETIKHIIQVINTNGGNYNERIEGNYIQGNYYTAGTSSEQEKIFPEICKNRESLNEYLNIAVENLKAKFGFLDIKNNIDDEQALKLVARKTNFDMSISFVPTRGEAFVIFAEFEQISADSLREFSTRCLKYAKAKTNFSTVEGAVYNFKFPTNLCFAIALVDDLDDNTRRDVQKRNPLKHSVDLLWYEIPIVYELNKKQLYFYEKPSDWTDHFTGEIAWKPIRKIIQEALIL